MIVYKLPVVMDYTVSLFIFRRDYRLVDNSALIKAFEKSEKVIPLFIFTPAQISNVNKFKSSNAIQFMIESLIELDNEISNCGKKMNLWTIYDDEIKAVKKVYDKVKFDAIFVNADYTPYSIERDTRIEKFCKKNKIDFVCETDLLLIGDNQITTNKGDPYHVYGLFYKKALDVKVDKPKKITDFRFLSPISDFKKTNINKINNYLLEKGYYQINDKIAVNGGRHNAIDMLKKYGNYKIYSDTNSLLSEPTTKLSAHIKFGTVSIREVYQYFKKDKTGEMHRKLYWRDFYYYISIHFDKLYKHEYLLKNISTPKLWSNNVDYFKAWKTGTTGFPVVDAAMMQLNTTGFMHNRGRLIVSEFLVKDLRISWKNGERYFAKKLVDIDRAQNTGNWNWSSSFGLDSTPFLRIFNPWTQSKKFDPDCVYIKKWLPVLKNIPDNKIHQWYKYCNEYPEIDYPNPIVDHKVESSVTRDLFKKYVFKK